MIDPSFLAFLSGLVAGALAAGRLAYLMGRDAGERRGAGAAMSAWLRAEKLTLELIVERAERRRLEADLGRHRGFVHESVAESYGWRN